MTKLLQEIQGKKTYIVAACIALIVYCKIAGAIDGSTYETLMGLFGGAGLVTMRLGIQKAQDAASDQNV